MIREPVSEIKKGFITQIKGRYEKITDADLPKGFAVVFTIAILTLVDDYIYFFHINHGSGGFGFFAAIFLFVAPVASWSLLILVIHSISVILGGKGGLKRFFAMCGFAYIPIAVQKALQIIVDLLFMTQARSTTTEQGLIGLLLDHFNLFKILVLFLVAIALIANYGLNTKKAVIITLIPDLALIIFSLILFTLNIGGLRLSFLGTARRLIRRF